MRRLLNHILNESVSSDYDFEPFIQFACDFLKIERDDSKIEFVEKIEGYETFGTHNCSTGEMQIAIGGRHPIDVMRTVAHELVHRRQFLTQDRELDGSTGSDDENEANALAGIIMREYSSQAFKS